MPSGINATSASSGSQAGSKQEMPTHSIICVGLPLALFPSCDHVRAMICWQPLPSETNLEMTTRTIAIERYVVQLGGKVTPRTLRPQPNDAADETAVIFRRRRRR